jgi:hypothetical protein
VVQDGTNVVEADQQAKDCDRSQKQEFCGDDVGIILLNKMA